MRLSDLQPAAIDKIRSYRWDRIIEKHEGPEDWSSVLQYHDPEFMQVNGRSVLLPVRRDQHSNMRVLRCIVGNGGEALTLFLKDTTYASSADERFFAGFLAVCDRVDGEDFYVAVVYHEWFIIDENPPPGRPAPA